MIINNDMEPEMSLPLEIQDMIDEITDAIDLGEIEVNQWEQERLESWADYNQLSDKQIAVLVKIHKRISK